MNMDITSSSQDKLYNSLIIRIALYNKNEALSGEFVLKDAFPNVNDIDREFYAVEDNYYSVKVYVEMLNEEMEEINMFLNDTCIKTVYPDSINYIEEDSFELVADYDNYFSMCYDMSYFCVRIKLINGMEYTYYSPYFVIATKAYLSELVSKMLNELETLNEGLLQACFSKSLSQSSLKKNCCSNIYTILNKLEEIINKLKLNYKYFCINPATKIGNQHAVVEIYKAHQMDNNSFEWLARSPENLVETSTKTDICIGNNYYIPKKVLTSTHKRMFNTYENEIILAFIWNICTYIDKLYTEFDLLMNKKNMDEINSFSIPQDYEIPLNIIHRQLRHQYAGILKELSSLRNQFRNQFTLFSEALKCKVGILDHRPVFTHTFREIRHYRNIFECMVVWFDYGNYTLNGAAYLFKMKTIDKIFEFYSLCRIIKCFGMLNFELQESFYYEYERPNKDNDIPNTFIFSDTEYKLTLYYQPQIYSYKSMESNDINLYRADGKDFYEPDFLLKIVPKGSNQEYYYIFDSKFSSNYTVGKHGVLEEEILKYVVGIAGYNRHFSPVVSMWLLIGKTNRSFVKNYKKVIGQRKSLPTIGVLSLSPEVDDSVLLNFFQEHLSLIQDVKEIV